MQNKRAKAREKDDNMKRIKSRLKSMKKDNNNCMGKGKQEQKKGDIRTMA